MTTGEKGKTLLMERYRGREGGKRIGSDTLGEREEAPRFKEEGAQAEEGKDILSERKKRKKRSKEYKGNRREKKGENRTYLFLEEGKREGKPLNYSWNNTDRGGEKKYFPAGEKEG